MKNFTLAFCFFALFLTSNFSQANNSAGGQISYRALDSVTYEVTAKIYIQCDTGGAVNDTLLVSWAGGSFTTVMTLVTVNDVTGTFNGCTPVSTCKGNNLYSYSEYLFKDTVTIAGPTCKIRFSYKSAARPASITTGMANTPFYIFAELDKCKGMNNSAYTHLPPKLIVPVGQDFQLAMGYMDTIDGDSVHFSLVNPQREAGINVSYIGLWGPQKPLSYLGFPTTGLSSPAGFHFDEITSEIYFRPTKVDEQSVIVIEAKEYRKINGQMEEVGRNSMEFSIVVKASPSNRAPQIFGIGGTVCAGRQICFQLTTSDTDPKDTVKLSWVNGLKGVVVIDTVQKRLPYATVCWTPTEADARNWPHIFTVKATDNGCSPNATSSRAITVYVRPKPDSSFFEIEKQELRCNRFKIAMKNPVIPGMVRKFSFSPGLMLQLTPDSAEFVFDQPGWNRFTINISYNYGACVLAVTDSVFVNPPYTFQVYTTPDTTVCPADSFTLQARAINGTMPYTYSWQNGPAAPLFKSSITAGFRTYYVLVSDSLNCTVQKKVLVQAYKPLPVVFAFQDSICANADSMLLIAMPSNGLWSGDGVIDSLFFPAVAGIGLHNIQYHAIDSNGCKTSAAKSIRVLDYATPQFTSSTNTGAPPLSVNFVDQTIKRVTKRIWIFAKEDGTASDTVDATSLGHTINQIFTDTGWYNVSLEVAIGRCETSSTKNRYIHVVLPVGIEGIENSLLLYPNPASDRLYIESQGQEFSEIICTDVLGRQYVLNRQANRPVDISALPEGFYTLEAITGSGLKYFSKILVQR